MVLDQTVTNFHDLDDVHLWFVVDCRPVAKFLTKTYNVPDN